MAWYKTTPVQRTPKYNVASGTIANFETNLALPMKSVVVNIVPIQSGTGTPSPSNPRPISGTSALNVEHRGKNLNGFTLADFQGGIVVGNARFIGIKIPKSTITYSSNAPTGYIWVARDFTNITTANNRVFDGSPVTYDNVEWLCIGLQKDNMETAFEYLTQAEYGNVATTFEPYNAETHTFDLGQEILGGTADVVGGSGTNAFSDLDLSSLEWTYSSTYQRFSTTSQVAGIKTPPNNNTVANVLCSHFNSDTSNNTAEVGKDNIIGVSMTGVIQIRDTSLNGDISALMTLLENVDFVYELATPTDFTFEGQPINSYLGTNNVWTDSGEVLDVEYAYMPTGNSGAYFPAGSV